MRTSCFVRLKVWFMTIFPWCPHQLLWPTASRQQRRQLRWPGPRICRPLERWSAPAPAAPTTPSLAAWRHEPNATGASSSPPPLPSSPSRPGPPCTGWTGGGTSKSGQLSGCRGTCESRTFAPSAGSNTPRSQCWHCPPWCSRHASQTLLGHRSGRFLEESRSSPRVFSLLLNPFLLFSLLWNLLCNLVFLFSWICWGVLIANMANIKVQS